MATKRTHKQADQAASAPPVPVISYKGLDKDFRCRGHQFEVGKTYTVSGKIEACLRGFHACENPFDVWSYYGPGEGTRFAIVEQSGDMSRCDEDSKIASAAITIQAEISLPDFIRRAVAWIIDATKDKNDSGDGARIGSSGYGAQIGSSGYGARIGSSGDGARIGSSGDRAQIGSSGYGAQIGSSGDGARIGSSGDGARIGSSGYGARIGSSGDGARIGSSGDRAQIGSSGYGAQIGSSGDGARIDATGHHSVVACAGEAAVKGSIGTHIAIMEYAGGSPIGFCTGVIGRDGLEPGVWYVARGGKLVPEG